MDSPSTSAPPPDTDLDENREPPATENGSHPEQKKQRQSTTPSSPSPRLASLDAFRGLTILGMLLVNNASMGTATPRQLLHAGWNQGVHFADLVFPWFLLIVGVAIPFAAASHRRKGGTSGPFLRRVLGRVVMLVLLGCLVDSSVLRTPVFGLGVLQLIGLAYGAAALLYGLPFSARMAVAAGFLIAHWAALRFVPVPGIGAGAFEEGCNLIHYLNSAYLGPYHLRGILSVIPTTALVLIGTAVGDHLRRASLPPMQKVLQLLAGGLFLATLGWLWSFDLPYNKPVWTASYIIFTAGLGILVLAGFYLLVDVKEARAFAFPFIVPGSNAIMAYVLPILVKVYLLQTLTWTLPNGSRVTLQSALLEACREWAGPVGGGWLYTLGYLFFWWLILLWVYRKGIYLKV